MTYLIRLYGEKVGFIISNWSKSIGFFATFFTWLEDFGFARIGRGSNTPSLSIQSTLSSASLPIS